MAEIDDLIARLETATEGGPGLDGAIYRFLNPERCAQYKDDREIRHAWTTPQYTTSLDAALTLVPANAHWQVSWPVGEARVIVNGGGAFEATGGTAPLALCIAALKARQAQKVS